MEKFFAKHLGGRVQKDVRPEIQKNYDALMVPVASVTLQEPEGDIDAAMTAALPAVDANLITPGKLSYKAVASVQGMEVDLDVTVEISEGQFDGKPAWMTVSTQNSMMGNAIDTFVVDGTNLLPLYRGVKQGGATVTMEYSETAVKGEIAWGRSDSPWIPRSKLPSSVTERRSTSLYPDWRSLRSTRPRSATSTCSRSR